MTAGLEERQLLGAAVAEVAQRIRSVDVESESDELLAELVHDYGVASRAFVGLKFCARCGRDDCFSVGRFLGEFYVTSCRWCTYIAIVDLPKGLPA